ncbi:hypothetical protein BGZ96_010795 [Linnemannia gamsii]|uniref:Serpin domain-containing protein n=1 Tax=Linnemannia gamsii TaxID=64522 RepID=A0ABQ7JTK7_9FUNG|nr:hypothetical protein BGZ96_010795 [Linnemannia gamsii]
MTPMQELNRTSFAVLPTLQPSSPSARASSSPLFQQIAYGSESTVATSASSSSSDAGDNKGLLSSGDEKKSSSSSDGGDYVRAEMGHHRPINTSSDSDSDESSDGGGGVGGGGVNLKDEQSPIAEVAAVVSNTDDPSLPCLTFRFFRDAPMVVSGLVIQLLSYP